MKFKSLIVSLLIVLIAGGLQAQNPNLNKGISFRPLFMDYQSQNNGSITAFNRYHHGFEVAYHKRINQNVKFVLPVNVGVVSNDTLSTENLVDDNCLHKTVYGFGGQVQYEFGKPDANVIPYIMGGVDAVFEKQGDFNLQIPLGFGLNFKMADNAYWFWQSDYRFSLSENRNNLHHGLGFVYLWDGEVKAKMPEKPKGIDSDGDGIINDLDLCPTAAGPRELKGCPDRDGDNIADFEDDCPDVAGLQVFRGCPDSDGDGVSDKDDECPNMVGVASNKGCPDNDKDGDGITDNLDRCPDIAGTAENNGCPSSDADNDGIPDFADKCPNEKGSVAANGCPDIDNDGVPDNVDKCRTSAGLAIYGGCPDTDGDGIDDSRDRCPNRFGSVATNGCPEIATEDRAVLELAMRAVQFDTGKSTLRSESYDILRQISAIMVKYPNYNLSINGHTDNVGNAVNNQKLSEKRAKACYDYLVSLGVQAFRMNYVGYGEVSPISDNATLRGRALNRRTEFTLSPR